MIELENANNHEKMWVMVANIQHIQAIRQGMSVLYMQTGAPLAAVENPATVADKVNAYLAGRPA